MPNNRNPQLYSKKLKKLSNYLKQYASCLTDSSMKRLQKRYMPTRKVVETVIIALVCIAWYGIATPAVSASGQNCSTTTTSFSFCCAPNCGSRCTGYESKTVCSSPPAPKPTPPTSTSKPTTTTPETTDTTETPETPNTNGGNSGGGDSGKPSSGSNSNNNNGGSNSGSSNNGDSGSSSSNNNNNNGGSNSGGSNNGDSDGTDDNTDSTGDGDSSDDDDTAEKEIDPSEISPAAFEAFVDSEYVFDRDANNQPCTTGNLMSCPSNDSQPNGLFNQQEFNSANFGKEFYDEYLSVDGQVPVKTPDGKLINKDNFIASGCIAVSVLGQAVRNIEKLREEGFDVPTVTMAHIKYAIHVAINTDTGNKDFPKALQSDGTVVYPVLIPAMTEALMVGCDNCDGVKVEGKFTDSDGTVANLKTASRYAIYHAGRDDKPHAYTAHGDGTFYDPYKSRNFTSTKVNEKRGDGAMRIYRSTLTYPGQYDFEQFKQTIRKVPIGIWHQLYFKKEESTVIL